ncbi:type II toxin-antitoxin system RatA family toxin [Labrenzia sp. 011]|uniref:type II toxin-antitoxin system RatA family toxin n=1 Tax=Labrenzia sp. 011 TaxID=2171494 RepID=UPI000D507F07|nr:type II toxin-antitoxin system RatA family toxin [Labrenzia sp. 011]PVB62748.1 ubiquinone-binding protein [Labrenzia sp. 011]
MPSFSSTHKVNHAAADMFRLVADVEQYPQFVPLCQDLHVRGRKELENGATVLIADMTVAYKLFKETFTSRVELRPEDHTILVEYLDGPFKHLENKWTFEDLGEGASNVGFFISYEFRSRTLGSVMGVMFDRAFRKFSNAFEARADEVYGT